MILGHGLDTASHRQYGMVIEMTVSYSILVASSTSGILSANNQANGFKEMKLRSNMTQIGLY